MSLQCGKIWFELHIFCQPHRVGHKQHLNLNMDMDMDGSFALASPNHRTAQCYIKGYFDEEVFHLIKNYCILIQALLRFVAQGTIDKSTLVQVMAWHLTGAKPLLELMMTHFTDAHIYITRLQWVNRNLITMFFVDPAVSQTIIMAVILLSENDQRKEQYSEMSAMNASGASDSSTCPLNN